MVLIIALLAPNVFAATPAPEAPLADAATVARVKQEIAAGEITDMEDLFLVAYQHLGADLETEGMTAYINEDGTLGLTQIIDSENKMTRSGQVEEKTIAVTTFAILDNQANLLTDYEYYYNYDEEYSSGSLSSVYASHTAYINAKYPVDSDGNGALYGLEIQLNYMVTNISYSNPAYLASKMIQSYYIMQYYTEMESGSRTVNNPASSTHTYDPGATDWYDPTSWGGGIYTAAEIWIANTGESFELRTVTPFDNNSYID